MSILASVPIIWWAGSLWSRLHRVGDRHNRLALIAVLGLLIGGVGNLTQTAVSAVVALRLPDVGAVTAKFFFVLSLAFGAGGLIGIAVADGEWYRLITSAFLHATPLHLALNMLVLWIFGSALESAVGRGRFIGVYFVSALAGSAGALLLSEPFRITVGASAAVFGVLGAGLVLERRNINVYGGRALIVVAVLLAYTFLAPNVSVGGHLGGLVGGMLAMAALSIAGRHPVYGRFDLLSLLALLAIAAGSIFIAYLRVRGYPTGNF